MYEEFAAWLREQIRRNPDLNQTGLAHKLGVERSTVSAWVHGRAAPRDHHLEAIAELFNADKHLLYIMLGRIDPDPDIDPEIEMIARRIGEAPPAIRDKLIRLLIAMLEAEGI